MVNSTVFLGGRSSPNESLVRGVERSLIECLYIQTHTYIPHKHTFGQARQRTLTYILYRYSQNNGARDKMDFH